MAPNLAPHGLAITELLRDLPDEATCYTIEIWILTDSDGGPWGRVNCLYDLCLLSSSMVDEFSCTPLGP